MEGIKLNSPPVLRCDRLSRPQSAARSRRRPRPDALPELATRLARASRKLFRLAPLGSLMVLRRLLALRRIPPLAARTRYRTQYHPQHWPHTLNSTWRLHAAALGPRIRELCCAS